MILGNKIIVPVIKEKKEVNSTAAAAMSFTFFAKG